MSLLTKLLTLLRGVSHETGQKIVDANAITILEQEIRDTGTELQRARDDLAKLMAQAKLAQQKMDDRTGKMAEYAHYIEGSLDKGDEALAREIAAKLAPLEAEQKVDEGNLRRLQQSIATLKATIGKTEIQLKGLRSQVDTVKATASVQRAQMAIASRTAGSNSRMGSALDSLERIKQRQAEAAARIEASEELDPSAGDAELERKLAAAGLVSGGTGAEMILARFKQERTQGSVKVESKSTAGS